MANVPLQKQVVATEDGFGIGRFFGNTLISMDIGGKEREALNLVLRQMLNLATFELLTQVMNPGKYADCMQLVEAVDGVTDNSLSKRKLNQYVAEQTKAANLGVVLVIYSFYAFTFSRVPHAQKIAGTGLVTPSFTGV